MSISPLLPSTLLENGRRSVFPMSKRGLRSTSGNLTPFDKHFYKNPVALQMDERQTENPIPMDRLDNTNLPVITANLEMLTIETNPPPTETKRTLRKRITRPVSTEVLNRRCSLRPKKRRISEMEAQEETIKEYYLDKSINKKSNNLETIYEENDNAGDDAAIRMSAKRFKRMLMFSPTTSKLKKRRAKIQKVFGSKIKYKRCGSMQALVDKLNTIRESSPMKMDSELK